MATGSFEVLRRKIAGVRAMLYFDNRWQLLVNRALFRASQDIYRLGPLRVLVNYDTGDANGVRECLSSPMYRDLLRAQRFEEPINLLDIGAHTGGFSLLCQHLGIPLKRVVSVELNPRTMTRLVYNLASNLQCECAFENVAVSSREGSLDLLLGRGSVVDSIYGTTEGASAADHRPACIRSLTFDTLYERHFHEEPVDLCKIDVEGAEHEMLSSPGHERLRSCRYLIIEIHGQAGDRGGSLRAIEELGYRRTASSAYAPEVHLFENQALRLQAVGNAIRT